MKKKKYKTRNLILVATAIFIALFVIYTLIFYSIKGWQWDGLFPYLLGVSGVVDVMTAIIALKDK